MTILKPKLKHLHSIFLTIHNSTHLSVLTSSFSLTTQSDMDLVVATSHGRSLERYFRHCWSTRLIWGSGVSIKSLVDEADEFFKHHRSNSMAGLSDLKERKRGKKYDEVIFLRDPGRSPTQNEEHHKISSEIHQENHNAKTCFATIIPISIKNNPRLSNRRTCYLKYEAQYPNPCKTTSFRPQLTSTNISSAGMTIMECLHRA